MSKAMSTTSSSQPRSTLPLVYREELVTQCLTALERGSVIISAPFGYGKTTLIQQVTDAYRKKSPQKRVITLKLSCFSTCSEALDALRNISCEYKLSFVGLIVLEDLIYFDEEARDEFEGIIASWIEAGVQIIYACTPFNYPCFDDISVSLQLTARDLLVKPSELKIWNDHYAFDDHSPVALSGGIPFLIEIFSHRQLSHEDEISLFDTSVKHLVMKLLNECVTDEMKHTMFLLFCIQSGSILNLKRHSDIFKDDLISYLSDNYPCFGISRSNLVVNTLAISAQDLIDVAMLLELPAERYIHEASLLCMKLENFKRAEELWNCSQSSQLGLELISASPFGAGFACSRQFLSEVFTHVDLEMLAPEQLFVGFVFYRRIALKRKVREYRKHIERNPHSFPSSLICCYNLLLIIDSLSAGLTLFERHSALSSDGHISLSTSSMLSSCTKGDFKLLSPFLHSEVESSEQVRSEFISQALLLSTQDLPLVIKQLWCHAAAMNAFYQGWELDIKTYLAGVSKSGYPSSVLDALLLVDKNVSDQGGLISLSSKQNDLSGLRAAVDYFDKNGWSDYSWYAQGIHAAICRRQLQCIRGSHKGVHALEKAQMVAARRSEKYYELYFSLNSAWIDLNEGNFVLGLFKTKRCFSILPANHTGNTWAVIYVIDTMLQIMNESHGDLMKRKAEVETALNHQIYATECRILQMACSLKDQNLEDLVAYSQEIKESIINPRYKTYLIQLLMIAYHTEFYEGCEYLLSLFEISEMVTIIQTALPELPETYTHELGASRADHFSLKDSIVATQSMESRLNHISYLHVDNTEPCKQEQKSSNPYLFINLLGGFRLTVNGRSISERKFGKRKALQLFVLLALRAGKEVTRTKIIEELWPGQSYHEARNSLYSCLSAVRSAIGQGKTGPEVIVASRDTVKLDMQYVSTDVQLLSEQLASLRTQHSALEPEEVLERCALIQQMYHGDVIEVGIDSAHGDYESIRTSLKKEVVRVLVLASDAAHCCGDESLCLYYIERAYSMDRFREDLCALYMKALARNHQRAVAIDLYYRHIKSQSKELGLPASKELINLYESIVKEAYSENENRQQKDPQSGSQNHQERNQAIVD